MGSRSWAPTGPPQLISAGRAAGPRSASSTPNPDAPPRVRIAVPARRASTALLGVAIPVDEQRDLLARVERRRPSRPTPGDAVPDHRRERADRRSRTTRSPTRSSRSSRRTGGISPSRRTSSRRSRASGATRPWPGACPDTLDAAATGRIRAASPTICDLARVGDGSHRGRDPRPRRARGPRAPGHRAPTTRPRSGPPTR